VRYCSTASGLVYRPFLSIFRQEVNQEQQPDDDDLERLDNNNSSIKDTENPGGYVIVIVTVGTWTRTEPCAAFSECSVHPQQKSSNSGTKLLLRDSLSRGEQGKYEAKRRRCGYILEVKADRESGIRSFHSSGSQYHVAITNNRAPNHSQAL
jgi:hypothetical protein